MHWEFLGYTLPCEAWGLKDVFPLETVHKNIKQSFH